MSKVNIIDATKLFKLTPEEQARAMTSPIPYHERIDYFIGRMEKYVKS